jgi:hypothetical protein
MKSILPLVIIVFLAAGCRKLTSAHQNAMGQYEWTHSAILNPGSGTNSPTFTYADNTGDNNRYAIVVEEKKVRVYSNSKETRVYKIRKSYTQTGNFHIETDDKTFTVVVYDGYLSCGQFPKDGANYYHKIK